MEKYSANEKMQKLMRSYVPEFAYEPGGKDAGSVLTDLGSEMLASCEERYQGVIDKHRIQYLNLFDGLVREPISASRGYVQFRPVEGYEGLVSIPRGTRVLATGDKGEELVYSAEHGITATDVHPELIVVTDRELGKIVKKEYREKEAFTAFGTEGTNSTRHRLYLCFEQLFDGLTELDLRIYAETSGDKAREELLTAVTSQDFCWSIPVSYTHLDVYKRQAWKSDGSVQNQTGRRDVTETPGTQRNRQQSTVEPMQLVQRQNQMEPMQREQRAEQLSIPGSRWQSPAEAKNAPGQTQITSGTPGRPAGQTAVEAGQFRTPGHGISGQPIPGDSERGSQARPELAEVPMVHAASEMTGPEEAGENTGRSAEPGKLPGVAEQAVQETVQKIVRETVENVLQNTVEKTTGHIIEKKIEKETEKKVQQTAEQRTLQTIVENRVRDTVQNTAGYRMLQKTAQPGMPGDSWGIPQIGNGFQPVEMLQGETLEAIQPLGTPGLPYPWQLQSPGVIPKAAQIWQATRNGQPTLIQAFQMQAAGRRAVSRQTTPGQALETASMVYPEDREAKEQEASRRQMQEHIRNVTEELQEVRRSVRTEKKLQVEKQRELVREVITKDPELLTENAVSASVGRQVQKEVERYMDESLQNMTNRVYRKLEQKLRTERERRGLV